MPIETLAIPPKNFRRLRYPLLYTMEVGESFFVPHPPDASRHTRQHFQVAVLSAAGRVAGKKFTTRQMPGGIQCWRVE